MVLAPLHDVTDTVFRRVIAERGKPDVMFSEFVSVEGLMHEQSREKMIWRYLRYTQEERPLVAQIWGIDPPKFREVAKLCVSLGYDGIDINMGCPEKSAIKHGACSALVNTPKLAQEIVRATKEGAGEVPVSVKIRLGFATNVIEDWMKYLLETEPAVITVHGRTTKQMSRVPADWDSIGTAVQIAKGSGTLVIGNGDVMNIAEANQRVKDYGVDGVMFGRAIFHDHWLFNTKIERPVLVETRLRGMVKHARLYEEVFEHKRTFAVLRKHFKAYTTDMPGAKQLRIALMSAKNADEVEKLVDDFLAVATSGAV